VNGPAARFQLLRLAPDQHILMFTRPHIIIDGWSINVVVSELAEIYPLLSNGGTPGLAPALRFSTYARDQHKRDPEEAAKTESYWLNQFREPTGLLELPTDRPRPALKSYAGSSRCRRIDASLYQSLKKSGAKAGNTLFVTLLGAFQALVGRLCDQTEVVVGVPTAGQSLLEDQILVGHCVNFLPIRGAWSENTAIGAHLRTVSKSVLDAYEHQSYTLGTLVRKLKLAREANRVPLAEIQFNLERLADQIQLPGLNIDVAPNSKAAVNFDLFLNVIESESGLRLDCDYNTALFDAGTIDLWLDCYAALLESIVSDPATPVLKVNYLPAAERQRVLLDANRTNTQYPNISLMELFGKHLEARPQAIAARFRDDTLSYAALDARVSQLANFLLTRVGPGTAGNQRLVASPSSGRSTCWWLCWQRCRPVALMCRSIRCTRLRVCAIFWPTRMWPRSSVTVLWMTPSSRAASRSSICVATGPPSQAPAPAGRQYRYRLTPWRTSFTLPARPENPKASK